MKAKLSYRSFAAGEVSKRLGARVDQTKYQTGAHTLRNMVSTLEGAAMNRSGFGYVRPCHDFTATNAPRLLPFVFSDDQSYLIVLEHERLSVISLAEPQFVAAVNITGATAANPCVVTAVAHGLTTGDLVWIVDVVGMTEINNRFFRVVVLTANTFELEEESGTNVNSTAFTAYSSGGTVRKVYTITAPWDGADLRQIRFAQSADVMILTHPDYPVQVLTRTAGPVWTLTPATFEPGILGPLYATASGSAGATRVRYMVTAVDENTLEESLPRTLDSPTGTVTDPGDGVSPWEITETAHGRVTGDEIYLHDDAPVAVDLTAYTITVTGDDTYTLDGTTASGSPSVSIGVFIYTETPTRELVGIDLLGTSGPFQITEAAHGRVTGDRVYFPSGTAYVSDEIHTITVTGANTYTLDGTNDQGFAASLLSVVMYPYGANFTGTFPTSVAPATVTWPAVTGALEYNIYREINGVYGYIGTSAGTSFQDLGYSVDPFDTPPIDRDVYAATGDYPAAVGLFQQRLLLGGSENDPERIDAGRTGLFYNFTKSNPIQADDSFSWVMRSNQLQGIRHILEMSRCLIFTQASVFTLEGDDAGALVPTAINPRKRAEHGVGDVPPMAIGNAVVYVQASGKVVREILPGSGDDFNSKDLTVYSRHLFDRNSIVSWAYAEEPTGTVWAARDDGTMLGFTYLREHEVWGWHRHDTGAGDKVIDVCTVPEGNETATYAVVERFDIGAASRYYIERMATRQVAHQADGRFLDSYRYHESENGTPGDTYTLDYDSGAEEWTLEATGTTANWLTGEASADIGRIILLYGTNGERYWCSVLSITDANVAVVGVRTDVPGAYDDANAFTGAVDANGLKTDLFPETLPYVTADWSQSVDEITDLWHLEGREVYVVGDGYPQGPLTVTDGTITLATPAVQVVAGLRIVSELVTLEADNPAGETWTGKTKTVAEIEVRVEETDGLKVGTSWDKLATWDTAKRLDRPIPTEGQVYTGTYRVNCGGTRSLTGRVHLRQDQGLPTTILGVYPTIEIER